MNDFPEISDLNEKLLEKKFRYFLNIQHDQMKFSEISYYDVGIIV